MTFARSIVRRLPPLLCATLMGSIALAAPDTPPLRGPGEAHPIIGTWKWTRKFNNCTETYVYGSDGSLAVTSGAERSDNTFTVSRDPVAHGFFEVRMRVTKDHRGTDCAQVDEDDTGKEIISFILFEPTKGMFISCSEPRLQACFGPLVRQAQ